MRHPFNSHNPFIRVPSVAVSMVVMFVCIAFVGLLSLLFCALITMVTLGDDIVASEWEEITDAFAKVWAWRKNFIDPRSRYDE